ncbi:MAG: shikimate kinase [Candidatus Comchoanobacterales bacterium]
MDQSVYIAIIGFPGSGKTTLSQQLSKTLQRPVTHLDNTYEMSPREIIRQYGDNYFMWLENLQLHNLSKDGILDCGGGTPLFTPNAQWIKQSCRFCLYLDRPMSWTHERLHQDHGRYPHDWSSWWAQRHEQYMAIATHRYSDPSWLTAVEC